MSRYVATALAATVALAAADQALGQGLTFPGELSYPIQRQVFSNPEGPFPVTGDYPFEHESDPQLVSITREGLYRLLDVVVFVRGTPECNLEAVEVLVNGQVDGSLSFGVFPSDFPDGDLPPEWSPTTIAPALRFARRSAGTPFTYPNGAVESRFGSALDLALFDLVEITLRIRGTVRVNVPPDSMGATTIGVVEARVTGRLGAKFPLLRLDEAPPDLFVLPRVSPDTVPQVIRLEHLEFPPGGSLEIQSLGPQATVLAVDETGADLRLDGAGVSTIRATYQTPAGWPDIPAQTLDADLSVEVFSLSTQITGPSQVEIGQSYTWNLASSLPHARYLWTAIGPDGELIGDGDSTSGSFLLSISEPVSGFTITVVATTDFSPVPYDDWYSSPRTLSVLVTGGVPVAMVPTEEQECPNDDCDASCTSEGTYGRSVLVHSGEERLDRVDLMVPGRGELDFVLRRRYRSRLTWNGPIGHAWTHSYEDQLWPQPNGDVIRGNGGSHVDRWVLQPDGSYAQPEGFFGTLRARAEGGWILRERDGLKRSFTPGGRLERLEDRHGNSMLFEHDAMGLLVRVLDVYRREFRFEYEPQADGALRLARLIDFAGRTVEYSYDQHGDLVEVRSPAVAGTSNGNDFPNGRVERYTYLTAQDHPELNHNLTSVTFPEEVSRDGPPGLVWTYGIDPSDPQSFDRVLTETEGGTNHTGVAAGGTSTLSYEALDPVDHHDPHAVTRILDRNGNLQELYLNAHHGVLLRRQFTRGVRPGDPAVYETRYEYDHDGQLTRQIMPAGNELRLVYDSSGPRAAQHNLIEVRRIADASRGGGELVWTFRYEPLYQQRVAATDPRGNAPGYVPPLGTRSAERYTTVHLLDYQEGSAPVTEAVTWGIDLSGVARGLGDLNGDGRTDQGAGNVVRTVMPSVLLRPDSLIAQRTGSTVQSVLSEAVWNDHGQPLELIDPEGNVSALAYNDQRDPDGDGVLVANTPLPAEGSGYMRSVTRDARVSPRRSALAPAPVALKSSLGYDPVGHVVRARNPRGVVTALEVNALGEVVSVTRGDDVSQALASGQLPTGESALRFVARFFRDHDGRVIRSEVENRDQTTPGVGAYVEREQEYDLLGDVVSATAEVDLTTRLMTTFRYDANQNLVLVERADGSRRRLAWDERDMLFTATLGADAPEAATVRRDYDLNGNLVRAHDAEDTDGDGLPEVTTWTRDGHDRVVEVRDPLGNRALREYDPASNLIRAQVLGHPAAQPTAAAVLLAESVLLPDELGRVFEARSALFLADGFATARPVALEDQDGDGWVVARAEFDALSRLIASVEDDLQVSELRYDGASRLIETQDALGNRLQRVLDRNGNPLAVTSLEVATGGLVPSESFTTRYVWDQLDRLVRVSDNAGQTTRLAYDSRDNLIARSDARGPVINDPLGLVPGPINGPGNTSSWIVDGLDRVVSELHDLRVGGEGSGALDLSNPANPDGRVQLTYTWDAVSRLAALADDKGQTTSFGWDALDRKVRHTYADGEQISYVWDRDSHLRQVTDPNGSVTSRTYDALDRLVRVDVQRALGVGGSTAQTFAYDGLSRLVRASDDNGAPGAGDEVCEWVWDSLGRLLEERQNGRAISSRYTGDGKRREVVYPGGRTITRSFDAIDRIRTLSDSSGAIATSDWIGAGLRELRRANGNGTTLSFLSDAGQDTGWDAVQRVARLRVLGAGGAAILDREYGYDRQSHRTFERRNDDFGLTDRYTYDSLGRVSESRYDQDGLPGAVAREIRATRYQLDGVGNRVQRLDDRLESVAGPALALQASETVDLAQHALVQGHVAAAGPQANALQVGAHAQVAGNATAPQVRLETHARVDGNVSTNQLSKHSTASVGGTVGPYVAPPALPALGSIAPGSAQVVVPAQGVQALVPGSYASVTVQQHGRLVLAAGTYTLGTLSVAQHGTVEIQGPVVVRVASDLALDHHVQVVLAAGLGAADVSWETLDLSVVIGHHVQFVGSLRAPSSVVEVQQETLVLGWIQARRVSLGQHSEVRPPAGSGGGGGGGTQPVTSATAYGVNAVNEYTQVGAVARTHDDNGNLTDDGTRVLVWDAFNRLVAVARKSDGAAIAAYSYLPDGRRSRKVVFSQTNAGVVEREVRFAWDGAQEVEEQNAAGVTLATFVWSPVYVDELVEFRREAAHPLGAGSFYTHQDVRCDVVAVTNASGVVVEKRRYDDFGREEIRDSSGALVGASPSGLEYGFQGRRRDAETGWLYFRARMYDPETGRFLSRDPVWDAGNVGGWYAFVGNGPVSGRDPSGEQGDSSFGFDNRTFSRSGDTITVTINLDLRPGNKQEGDAWQKQVATSREKFDKGLGVWNAAAQNQTFTDPSTGKEFKLQLQADYSGKAGSKELSVYTSNADLPKATSNLPYPKLDYSKLGPRQEWKEIGDEMVAQYYRDTRKMQEEARKGEGVRANYEGHLSLQSGDKTWPHEIGHSLYLPHDRDDPKSIMNDNDVFMDVYRRHFIPIAWIASANDCDEAKKRATMLGLVGSFLGKDKPLSKDAFAKAINRAKSDGGKWGGVTVAEFEGFKKFFEVNSR